MLARVLNRIVRPLGLRCVKAQEIVRAPELSARHLAYSKVVPNRHELLELLPKGGAVAEVGVAFGRFTRKILDIMRPATFVAIDTFELDKPSWSGHQSYKDILGDLSHEAYYRQQFRDRIDNGTLIIKKGYSHLMLGECDDASFDMIYIDAAHDYQSVKQDLAMAKSKIKPDGYLVLNDYILMDPLLLQPYGIVQAVHEFCLEEGWEVRYLALHPYMFCDVGLKKL